MNDIEKVFVEEALDQVFNKVYSIIFSGVKPVKSAHLVTDPPWLAYI